MEVIGFIIGLIIFLGIIGGFFFLLYYIIKRLVNGKPKKKAVNKKEIVKKYLPHEVVKVEDVESGKTVHFGNKSKVVIGYDDFEKIKIYNFYECCGYLGDKLPIYSDLFFGIGFKKVDDQYLLTIENYKNQIDIKKGDELQLLFVNKEVKTFIVENNGVFSEKDDEGIKNQTFFTLTDSDFDYFKDNYVEKLRYIKKTTKEKFDFEFYAEEEGLGQMANNLAYCTKNY